MIGKYVETSGNAAASDCISCGAGKYVNVTGSSSSSDCIDCLAGRYVEDVGSGSLGDCIGCVAGKYAETSGNTAEYAVAESCSADLGSSVLSDSDLLEYVDVVEGVVADGFVVEVDTGYRNLTVDQCQAVCSNISVCAAVTWLHCCPSHCVLLSTCSGTSGWDASHWSDRMGLSYESRAVSAYESVRSGDSPGLVTWMKDAGCLLYTSPSPRD